MFGRVFLSLALLAAAECDDAAVTVREGGLTPAAALPPLATQLVRLWPEPGAGLRKGLTDIRMNGFYRLLETSRPVGRPG